MTRRVQPSWLSGALVIGGTCALGLAVAIAAIYLAVVP